MKAFLVRSLLLASFLTSGSAASGKDNQLPPEVEEVLRSPGEVILYSLEPWEQPSFIGEKLHGYKVLGHTKLDRKQTDLAIAEFRSALAAWDGRAFMCFDPRQALQITTSDHHRYNFLLCYSCHRFYVYRDDKLLVSLGVTGSAKILNGILSKAGVRLSLTDSDDERAARAKQSEAALQRWRRAMPNSIRPLWDKSSRDENILKLLRKALAKEFPKNPERILALFAWFGSGEGSWSNVSGYEYEYLAELLLFDFSTSDLISAAQAEKLSEQQMEGVARLFGGGDFSNMRPGDLKLLPPALKKQMLNHTLKSADKEKRSLAQQAFK
jgi:hypothetical protein